MKKFITIVSHERSGSTWLSSLLANNKNINLSGFFDPQTESVTNDILKKYLIDEHEIDISKNKKDIINNIINSNISINNKNIIIKIMKYHYLLDNFYNEIINKIINNSFIIKLYRKNILDCFISREKCLTSSCWTNTECINKNINKNNIKILWDKEKYLDFFKYKETELLWMKEIKKPSIVLEYETIKNINNKILFDYLKNKIENNCLIGDYIDNIYNINIKKENSILLPLENNFINNELFIKDLMNIPIYINYK